MKHSVSLSVAIKRSARVLQLEGLFDLAPSHRADLNWTIDLPLDTRAWHVGVITGPSGSGKSTIARYLWPEQIEQTYAWPDRQSLLDGFPSHMPTKEIARLLHAVDIANPEVWLRPYDVLSTGEQFRVFLARALAEATPEQAVVVDEYTSVVDRHVAETASRAISPLVRALDLEFVAVTCHDDVVDWLSPDWVYRPSANEFRWTDGKPEPTWYAHLLAKAERDGVKLVI